MIKKPVQLLEFFKANFKYGFKHCGKVFSDSDENFQQYMDKYYKIRLKDDFVKNRHGVCWDFCEYEREVFEKLEIKHDCYFLEGENGSTHTFTIFERKGKWCWFEFSWSKYYGIHVYDNKQQLLQDVVNKFICFYNSTFKKVGIYKYLKVKTRMNVFKFIEHCKNGERILIRPKLLLHSCCAPCSSSCIKQLNNDFDLTVFYYNPNILPKEEYEKRKQEQIKFIHTLNEENKNIDGCEIKFIEKDYNVEEYKLAIKGKEHMPEKSERCYSCYKLRMTKARDFAMEKGYDFFTTTLTVSPHKNSKWIFEIGKNLENEKVAFLAKDFKKNDGYKLSLQMSKQYNFYRQNYCGCSINKA